MVCGGCLEKRDWRVVVMEVRRACVWRERELSLGWGEAFSLSKESVLVWLDGSSFLGWVGGDDGIWEDDSEEGEAGAGNSVCAICSLLELEACKEGVEYTFSNLGINRERRPGHSSLQTC